MNLPIFFTDDIHQTDLNEDSSRHIAQVLRMECGERLQLTDGKGNLATAVLTNNNKKCCSIQIESIETVPAQPHKITIAISLVKNASRFEWFLEKATEIGVTQIIPLICARTEKQHFRQDRMQGILVSAMLQSKQTWLPVLHPPTKFNEVIAIQADAKWIAHCEMDNEKNQLSAQAKSNDTIILIGPEGDFTTEEITKAKQHFFKPVALGATRLRTETAGMVAVTLLQH
jgi:16S rRNA (uracil1498-N3)-methyltransferase